MNGRDDNHGDQREIDPDLAAMLARAVRAKVRSVAFFMAIAVAAFVWMAKDAGQPLWLVVVIAVLGTVLILLFVALAWFWLRFLSHFKGKS